MHLGVYVVSCGDHWLSCPVLCRLGDNGEQCSGSDAGSCNCGVCECKPYLNDTNVSVWQIGVKVWQIGVNV